MFIGAIPKKIAEQIVRSIDFSAWGDVYVGCSGSFRIEQAIRAQHPNVRIFSNDVSALSCAIGAAATGKNFQIEFINDLDVLESLHDGSALSAVAGIEVAITLSKYKGNNDFCRARKAAILFDIDSIYSRQKEKAAQFVNSIQIDGFFPEDFKKQIIRARERGGGVITFAPTYKGGYPAIAIEDEKHRKKGEALFPELKSLEFLEERKSVMYPPYWEALYQQNPIVAEGELLKPDRIQLVDALPASVTRWVRGWDLASTTDGDYTAGAKLGKLPDGRYVIADMVRLRRGPDERDAAIYNTAALDGRETRISLPQDPGQAGKTQVLYLTRMLSGFRVKTSPESGDKVTRAEPFAAQVNVGNVLMLRGEWNKALIDELRMFPNGTHDDQVDALSRAFGEVISRGRGFFG